MILYILTFQMLMEIINSNILFMHMLYIIYQYIPIDNIYITLLNATYGIIYK